MKRLTLAAAALAVAVMVAPASATTIKQFRTQGKQASHRAFGGVSV